jgi:hypothetical protein
MDGAGYCGGNYVEDISGINIPLGRTRAEYAVRMFRSFLQNINTQPRLTSPITSALRKLFGDSCRRPRCEILLHHAESDERHAQLTDGSPSTRTQGDNWLANQIPLIMNSPPTNRGGLIIVTWDEGTVKSATARSG